jgi:hypothetical protein
MEILQMRHFVIAGLLSLLSTAPLYADDSLVRKIEDIHKEKSELNGQRVTVSGTVVKVNNQIMNRNFLHIQDGSGDAAQGTNDLTVTSQETASVGDAVTVSGTVVLDQDFGFGYTYPLIVEQATIAGTE